MKIEKIIVGNFRILKNLEVELEDELTLILGRNNSGKTSLLIVLEKFLSGQKENFVFEDFNIELQDTMMSYVNMPRSESDFQELAAGLKIYISYTNADDIGCASELLLDLDVEKYMFVVQYEFVLCYEGYL